MISSPRTPVFGGLVGGYHENSVHGRTAASGTCSADWRSRWPASRAYPSQIHGSGGPDRRRSEKSTKAAALKAGVAKFVESVGGKLEFWYFDYGAATAYSVVDYPDEIAAATAQLSSNAAGFARVTIRPLLTAEEMDQAVAKWPPVRT